MTRRSAAAALLAAFSGVTSGCGGTVTATPRAVHRRVPVAQAVGYASTVNLGPADLYGWMSTGGGGTSAPTHAAVAAARCAGAVDPHRWILDMYSASYHAPGGGTLYSVVAVWPTAALATRNARAEASARGLACDRHEATGEPAYRASGGVLRRTFASVSALPAPLISATTVFARRTIWTDDYSARKLRYSARKLRLGRHRVKLGIEQFSSYEDVFGFVVGPAEVWLVASSVKQPIDATNERDTLMTIHARAEAHSLSVQGS